MNAQELKNKQSDAEELPPDEAKVARVLSSLPRVEAPANFEFQLRARIAQGTSTAKTSGFGPLPKLKYFAPLALVAIVGAFFGLNFFYSTNDQASPVIAEAPALSSPGIAEPQPPGPARKPGDVPLLPVSNEPPSRGREEVAAARRKQEFEPKDVRGPVKGRSGSLMWNVKPSKVINPPGIDPDTMRPHQEDESVEKTAPQTSVRESLKVLGIDAEPTESGWRVRSAAASSMAERSGIKAGDVIESLDDRKIGRNSSISGSITVKTIQVLRDGKSLTLTVQGQP